MSRETESLLDLVVDITISSDEFLKLYEGVAQDVVTHAIDGRRVRFPARILKPYVTRTGVRGRFAIYFDKYNKFKSIDRL